MFKGKISTRNSEVYSLSLEKKGYCSSKTLAVFGSVQYAEWDPEVTKLEGKGPLTLWCAPGLERY